MSDIILFVAFPYVAVALAIVVGVQRYRTNRFSYSTLGSQLLENRTLRERLVSHAREIVSRKSPEAYFRSVAAVLSQACAHAE